MSKDKLISLIIRKQTYKDTKPYLTDLLNLKEQAVKHSIQAIKEILTTDYNAEAKLYAVRYMKDAFEKANPSFINLVEKDLLPLLINISIDQNDEKSVMKYAGSSYTKSDELSKFKAIVSSLFRMVKQCLIKWAEWIPDQDRKFIHALNQIKKKSVDLNFQWKYFRPQNEQLFFQCCQKNGLKLGANTKSAATAKTQEKQSKKAKDPLVVAIQQSLAKVKDVDDQKQLKKVENDFNEAINNYLQNSSNFQEVFVQQSFEQFQQSKTQALKRIRNSAKKIKQSAAAAESVSKEKSVKKLESSANKVREQSKPQVSISAQKIQLPPAQIKSEKKNSKHQVKITPDENINKISSIKSDQIIKENVSKKDIQIKKQVRDSSKKPQSMLQHQLKEQIQRQIPQQIKEVKAKPKIVAQQLQQKQVVTEQFKKPVPKTKQVVQSKQSKVPTSPKRGPIKFEQESQSPFSSKQASNVKEDQRVAFSKPSVKDSSAYKSKADVSQQSQRVNFSDEQSSEHSQDGHHRFQPRDFKKKVALTPIKQETFRSPTEEKDYSVKGSRIGQEQSNFTNRQKKGGATHKLMEENRLLSDKYDMLWKQFEAQKREKQNLLKEKQALQKQLRLKAENEERLIKKLKGSVPIEDYNKIRQQLQEEKQKKQNLMRQNLKIRSQHHSLIEQLNQTKYRLKSNHQEEKPKTKIKQTKVSEPVEVIKPILSAPVIKEELDQDYVKNLTHTSNLRRWLNKANLFLFKKNVLSISEIAYRDDYLCILAKSSVYTQNNEQFLSMTLTFQFKSLKQVKPHVRYVNCQELDIWSKPLTGQGDLYTQQLAVRLHSNPLKVIKAELKVIEVIDITFLLPAIYLNFLREEEFSNTQFEQIFAIKSEQLLKSKITQWNKQIIKEAADIQRLFKNSVLLNDKLRLCLSQGINDQIFMAQFQILRNNKFLLRVLPIPYSEGMIVKGKQLIENIVFLLS